MGDGSANRVGTVVADDWASQIGRPDPRTFTWRITEGAAAFPIEPGTGELRVACPELLDELTTYTLTVRVSDGRHESGEARREGCYRGPCERGRRRRGRFGAGGVVAVAGRAGVVRRVRSVAHRRLQQDALDHGAVARPRGGGRMVDRRPTPVTSASPAFRAL